MKKPNQHDFKNGTIFCEKAYLELGQKLYDIFEEEEKPDKEFSSLHEINVSIYKYSQGLEIRVYRMYDWYPIPFNYNVSEKISKLLGTRNFEVDKFSRTGCETCDYGSSYGHEFFVLYKDLTDNTCGIPLHK